MAEKSIRAGIRHWYGKFNDKYMKIMIKIKNHQFLSIRMQIIYIDGQRHDCFLRLENISQFNKDFIETKIVIKDIFL